MQYVNTISLVEHVNIPSKSIENRTISSVTKQLLLDIQTQYITETTETITLNCSGLESITSHGICLLIKLLIYSRSQHKRLQVFGLSEHNQYIFEITHLNKFIDIAGMQPQTMMTVYTDLN